ncbi:hypothetical protein N5T66_04285 [Aliarcobacter cryaerophilus]|uniref:gp53-like domain-containing protein n=1 Tax=Aliarcobacter cryaerophilus TaxID=28198 RepID=UPI0021B28A37|nr:hypothetical protein [Aliarcobacter cryaerophilus]MCT7432490.1 hypothetical protein [Aliarcobacter cryaerophilus]
MSKLERVNANVEPFAINSPNGNRYAFGTTNSTDNINDNYNENIKKGFGTSPNDFPELEDFNALMFTESYLSGYLYQEGVPEWNDKQKYYVNSITKGSNGELYKSLSGTAENPNVGNNPTIVGSAAWKSILNDYVNLSGNQTIAGVKTFSSSPIVPTPTTGTQAVNKTYADLKVALTDFTGANQSLTAAGYQKLPGGLIIQWGYNSNLSAIRQVAITFPVVFPNLFLSGSLTTSNSAVAIDNGGSIYAVGKSGMAADLNQGYSFYWFAIGY